MAIQNTCLASDNTAINYVIERDNGTVVGFYSENPITTTDGVNVTDETGKDLSLECCLALNYSYDSVNNFCFWRPVCNQGNFIKLLFAPNGDDGSQFIVNSGDTCALKLDFDYLLEFDSVALINTPVASALSGLSVSVTVEKMMIKPLKENVVYETPSFTEEVCSFEMMNLSALTDYIKTESNTGLRVVGNQYNQVVKNLKSYVGASNSKYVTSKTLNSCWRTYSVVINDPVIINNIANSKIKLGIKISGMTSDLGFLIDRINMVRLCETTTTIKRKVTKSPGFTLERIVDNKKTWSKGNQERSYDLYGRETKYNTNDDRLIINSKEVDLRIDPSSAIEDNVYRYYNLNQECLTEDTILSDVLNTDISGITTANNFTITVNEELIDVKNRQTIQSYPTLRYVYDKYMNPSDYGCSGSSMFNYSELIKYSKTIGNYWFDMIEQLVPATTLWGSSYVYRNSVYDNNKFRYKQYILKTCDEPSDNGEIASIAQKTSDVGVEFYEVDGVDDVIPCSAVYINKIGSSPVYYGTVYYERNKDNNPNIITTD